MAGNTVYVQGNYVDVHDNEVVNLSIDKVGTLQVEGGQHQDSNAPITEEPLRPGIFDTRIFNSNERLVRLRDTIGAAINMGDASIMYGKPQEVRINPTVQSEWYYILKAVREAGVNKSKLKDTDFVEQMVEWFPMLFPDETPEKFKEFKRRLQKSISSERAMWKQGKMKEETTLKDMWAKGISNIMGSVKANRIYEIVYKGLYTNLTCLKHEIERENSK